MVEAEAMVHAVAELIGGRIRLIGGVGPQHRRRARWRGLPVPLVRKP